MRRSYHRAFANLLICSTLWLVVPFAFASGSPSAQCQQALSKHSRIPFSYFGARDSKSLDEWLSDEYALSVQRIRAAISPSDGRAGAIIASPSRSRPNYYYNWVRDAALTMDAVAGLYERTQSAADKASYEQIFFDYLHFTRQLQLTPNRSGFLADHFAGYGEPKFNVDGSAFNDNWGRPQNDGPALRAMTILHWLKVLPQDRRDAVIKALYDTDSSKSLLKSDLEFVAYHWRDTSYDLWEEVRGRHFYTAMVQRSSLLQGADLAESLGDTTAAAWYRQQAKELETEINRHWDAQKGYILTTFDAQDDGGKTSNLDASVILAALHAGSVDGYFGPTDDRILASAYQLQRGFAGLYDVNSIHTNSQGEKLGVAIGRYVEDNYDGYQSKSQGNPWILLTNAYAELAFRAAKIWKNQKRITVSALNFPYLASLSGITVNFKAGDVLNSSDPRFQSVLDALNRTGMDALRRVRFHAPEGGALAEEINRYSGYMQGAEDLTWNYASLLTALWSR